MIFSFCTRIGAIIVFAMMGVGIPVEAQTPPAPVPVATKPAEAADPVPTGNLFDKTILCEFAVYLLPGGKAKPEDVLKQLLGGQASAWAQVGKLPDTVEVPTVFAHRITDVAKSYQPPKIDALQYFGQGLSKEQAEQLQTCDQAYVLDFVYPSKEVWKSLRSATTLAGEVARQSGGLVWDQQTREVFTPEEWTKKRVADWTTDEVPDIAGQTTIHAYKDGEYVRAVMMGMSKFGLPDIAVPDFVWSDSRSVGHLINLLAQTLAEGTTLTTPGELDLNINQIKNAGVREAMLKNLLSHAVPVAKLGLVMGEPEKGDEENRLINITFDRYEGTDNHTRQNALLRNFFGWEDKDKPIRHNEELLAASQRARSKLPELRALFQKGLAPGEYIQVKCPFDAPNGETEWMWVEIESWKDDAIKGLLKNEPFHIPTLHEGQTVDVSEKRVFDYIHIFPDGHDEGYETGPIIEKMQGAEEKGR